MRFTRRDFGKLALAAGTAARLMAAKLNSTFNGVHIGIVTYSFRDLHPTAEQLLQYCVDLNIDAIELMNDVPEAYAGAPTGKGKQFDEELRAWRTSVSMDRYRALRHMYEDAGVKIYGFKLPPTMAMTDAEYEYIWNVGETLGVDQLTMELPGEKESALLHRVADYAERRKLRIAFHTHGQNGLQGFDEALALSPYTALNIDVGHYWGVNGESPVPVVEKYHERIASLHLKDRKAPVNGKAGDNVPWGQGSTPLKQLLQVMEREQYRFPASIEYEYTTPEGSTILAEIGKCLDYCKEAIL
ncbi:MAG TPA: TIM barrel protein [Verrucomicrobiae bacterium]|nr:TIM barrel protein [Verrucomicrobiae bacterium]